MDKFSKNDTNIIKGIAILAMLFHHTLPNNPGIPLSLSNSFSFVLLLASSGKVCVSLFTMISGYGLAESYRNVETGILSKIRFCLSHYIQLISVYLCILLWSYMLTFLQGQKLSDIYGPGMDGLGKMMIDMLGLGLIFGTPVYVGTWYISTIVVLYAIFPILFYLQKKLGWIMLVLTYSPWIYYLIKQDVDMHTDWGLFYVFSFVVGIFLSQRSLLDEQKKKGYSLKKTIFAIVLFLVAFITRAFITLPADPLLAFAIIEMEILVLSKISFVSAFLRKFGEHSANIFYLHVKMMGVISVIVFANQTFQYIFLVLICLGFSLVIEEIKNGLHYNAFVRRMRKRIYSPH